MPLMDDPEIAARVAGRRDPRYGAVRDIIAAFDWPNGQPMVPDSWADLLATRVMAAVVKGESARVRDANEPEGSWGPNPDFKCYIADHEACEAAGCTCSCHRKA